MDDGNGRMGHHVMDTRFARADMKAHWPYSLASQNHLYRDDSYPVLDSTPKGTLEVAMQTVGKAIVRTRFGHDEHDLNRNPRFHHMPKVRKEDHVTFPSSVRAHADTAGAGCRATPPHQSHAKNTA